MLIKENTRKYILVSVVVIIVIGLIFAKFIGKKQDENFVAENMLYEQVVQLYSEQNNAEAAPLVEELLGKQPDAEIVNYLGGMIAAGNEDFGRAAVLLQKTMDINPYKVEDPMFMLQFAEVLVKEERFEDAKIVLVRCQEEAWAPEGFPTYQERVTELLADIEKQ